MHRDNDQNSSPRPQNQGGRGPHRRGGRNRSRGGQSSGQGQRGPRGQGGGDERGRDQRRRNRFGDDGDDGFRIERTAKPPTTQKAAKRTLGQKILRVITFGMMGGPAKTGKPGAKPAPAKNSGQPGPNRASGNRPPARQSAPSKNRASGEGGGSKSERPIETVDPQSIETTRLHVGNLSYDATESDLFELFRGFGKVTNTEIVSNPHTQRSKGFGFVQMGTVAEARRAVAELHGKDFMKRKLILGPAKSIERRTGPPMEQTQEPV